MKQKTRQILVLLAAAVVALMFAGCSQSSGSSTETSFTITFDKNTTDPGSTDAVPRTKTVTPPETIIDETPKEPTRPGYQFDGWYTTPGAVAGTRWQPSTSVTASLTVYAKWTKLQDGDFSVNFDKNGGDTEADPMQIVVYAPATSIGGNEYPPNALPTPPTKASSLFVNWNTKADGSGDEFTENTTVTDHIIVYAQWDAIEEGNVAVIFWDREGVTILKSIQIAQGSSVDAGDFPDKDTTVPYFQITSWKTANGTAFTSSTIVNATTNVYINVLTLVPGTPEVVGETLVHNYPGLKKSTVGMHGTFSGTENADGSVTFSGGAVVYTLPTPGGGDSWKISDYDLVTLYLTVAEENMGVISKQAANATDVLPYPSGNQWPTFSTGNTTWCVPIESLGTSGGIAFQRNNGGPSTFTLTKVVFEKGDIRTVTFDLNYAGAGANPADVSVLSGLSLGTKLPAPTRADYTFVGWYTEEDAGTRVLNTTAINADMELYAHWIPGALQPVSKELSDTNGTLFGAVGDYSNAQTYTYEDKSYWIISDARESESGGYKDWNQQVKGPITDPETRTAMRDAHRGYSTIGGYTRIAFNLNSFADITDTVTQAPVDWKSYSTITITYDLVEIGGGNDSNRVQIRNDAGAAGGAPEIVTLALESGAGKTTSFNVSLCTQRDGGGIGIVKQGTGAILLRITKVTLTP